MLRVTLFASYRTAGHQTKVI